MRHRYTCVPHPEPSSLLPPHTYIISFDTPTTSVNKGCYSHQAFSHSSPSMVHSKGNSGCGNTGYWP